MDSKHLQYSFRVMGGPAEIQVVAQLSQEQFESACALVRSEAERLEAKYSRYRPDSALSAINTSAGLSVTRVDSESAALIDLAAVAYEQSEGLFDVTSGVLRRVWDFKNSKAPRPEEVAQVLPLVGWSRVEWTKPSLKLPQQGMELDLGGLVKEFAVDRAISIFESQGISNAIVNFAGDVRVLGAGPSGVGWKVGIVHPRKNGALLASLKVANAAVATSGDYERYFEVAGRRYCHILNPKTGYPVEDLQSVTVLCNSCLVAGVASTTSMLLGKGKGLRYLKELGLKYVVVDQAGEIASNLALDVA
ncbi:MAG: FAD:protein FMN transferase [Oligoflexia bacterium]|nr:FAD:protein FMN transferase [Oligoflexia bacterium]